MSNKQGQPTPKGNQKQEGQGNQPHQEETKRALQQDQGGESGSQQGGNKQGTQKGSQKDKNGKIGQ